MDQTLPVLKPVKKTLESPPADNVQVTWMGHATVLVQMDGLNILTDPVFNDYCGVARMIGVKRYRPVPCTVDDLPDIDAVCISHNHYDHLDYTSVCALNKRFGNKIHWFVPMGLRQWMRDSGCKNVVELEWWEEHSHPKFTEESKAVKFCFTPAQHWCRRGINDTNKVLWGSWSVIGPRNRFFFAGDTGYHQIFKQIGKRYGPFDLAAIPIGAYEPRCETFPFLGSTTGNYFCLYHKDLSAIIENPLLSHQGAYLFQARLRGECYSVLFKNRDWVFTTRNLQLVTSNSQIPTHNAQLATHNLQLTTHNSHLATHDSPLTTPRLAFYVHP